VSDAESNAIGRSGRLLFVATILTGSFLLFLVQPMVARMALPRLGGAPAVWNSAMLVYQTLLLAGYAYAHALGRIRPMAQAAVHLGVLLVAGAWLPIGLALGAGPAGVSLAVWVPWLLGASIGPLFFAVSAQAPLVQRWFSMASRGGDPYALYAASNLGSFAGLIAYPLVVEPLLTLRTQSLVWSAGYVLLIALVVGCAWHLPRGEGKAAARPTSEPATRRRIAHWIALALVPSGLMLATSTYITTDIVAMPLLWVLPLGLYLLSFSVAFATDRFLADLLTRIAPITILLFGGVMVGGFNESPLVNLAIALTLLFMASVALHTQLYRLRPAPDRLTGFYLAMAVGGALGGVFAALIAPVVFDWTYEYPILIFAAGLLVPQLYLTRAVRSLWTTPRRRLLAYAVVTVLLAVLAGLTFRGPGDLFGDGHQGLTFIVIALIGVIAIGARPAYALTLAVALVIFGGWRAVELSLEQGARTRSYFGVYTVRDRPGVRELDHGTTVHGIQFIGNPILERLPTTYYAPPSGIGRAMSALGPLYGPRARVGVVGLGTGTLACYAQPGQRWRFYEIDPVVVHIARDTGQFTYLRNCLPNPTIRIGDARLSLGQDAPDSLDLLALDAFSSDAIPAHLMTREAFRAYARVLQPKGLLLVHISNRFLDLEPVVAALARDGGWHAAKLFYQPPRYTAIASASQWIALSRDPATLSALAKRGGQWQPLTPRAGLTPWTDDYSTILPLLKWGP
jgi:SAM-dependent methyltransferase